MTRSSSTVLEARSFGLRSAVTGAEALDLYADQVRSGWATLVTTPSGLNELLAALLSAPSAPRDLPSADPAGLLRTLLDRSDANAPR